MTFLGTVVALLGLGAFAKGILGDRDGLAALGAGLFVLGIYVAVVM